MTKNGHFKGGLPSGSCSRGWDKRCPAAKGNRCTCKCGAANHGKNHQKPEDDSRLFVYVECKYCRKQVLKCEILAHVLEYHPEHYHAERHVIDNKQQILKFNVRHSGIEAKCAFRIIKETGGAATVIVTELPDNPGISVTNAFEDIATIIFREHLHGTYEPRSIRWIEHYPDRGRDVRGKVLIKETFDEVTLKSESEPYPEGDVIKYRIKFAHPTWKPLKEAPAG
jgi:hypothetical protein